MKLSELATKQVKPILFAVTVLSLLGLAAYTTFPVAILPDVSFPRVVVQADSGDMPARMVEAIIEQPIENAISAVPGVSRITSRTKRGSTEVSIDFQWGTNILTAEQMVNSRVEQVRSTFPAGVTTETERMNPTVFPVVGLTLNSQSLSPSQLYDLAEYTLRPKLSRVYGVARVVVQGGRQPEVEVVCNPDRLAALHLSINDVSSAVTKSNSVAAVGRMNYRFLQFQVLVNGLVDDVSQLQNLAVATRSGQPILLKDVASVSLNVADQTKVVSANGKESVLMNVIRQPQANSVLMAQGVREAVAQLQKELPPNTKIGVFYDQSVLVQEAIKSVSDDVLIGALLAVVVLVAFLKNLRATLLTAAIIPVTILITFLLMRLSGLSLDLMTLGALAVAIGLVIDDAIVVVENIFRHLGPGVSLHQAVVAASGEIAKPMVSSTLTTVVVFLPLSLLQGVAGAFFTALAVTLAISLMVSLGLALFASPSLCAAFLKPVSEHHRDGLVTKGYQKVLELFLKRRYLVPIGAIALLLGTYGMSQKLSTGFMPNMDEGAFILDYVMPPGTKLGETNRVLNSVDQILQTTPEVQSFSRRTGTELGFSITEPNTGDYAVMLKTKRNRRIDDVIADVRKRINDQVPGLDVDFSQVLQDLIGDLSGSPAPIEVKVFGKDKTADEAAAKTLADKFGQIKGIADIQSGITESGPEYELKVNPTVAGRLGLTADDIASQATTGLLGTVATTYLQGDREVPVRVRYPETFWSTPEMLSQLPITLASGQNVPFGSLGSLVNVQGSSESFRENQQRLVRVTGRLDNLDLGTAISKIKDVIAKTPMPPGVTTQLGGAYESQQQSFNNLIEVLLIAVLLVYTVMLFQFGSFTAPTVILLVMPLGLFGAVLALWITNVALNVSSLMGAIMLVGIVVKNGILLLDRAQEAERDGLNPVEAVKVAAHQRLRPILMTTLTAILGLVPLALGIGAGAEMQQPLAITVIGGLAFSTVVTLIAAPVLYASFRVAQQKRAHIQH